MAKYNRNEIKIKITITHLLKNNKILSKNGLEKKCKALNDPTLVDGTTLIFILSMLTFIR